MQGFGLIIEDLDADAVRIALHGELDLAHAYTFDAELQQVEARRPRCICIDLRELSFLDSCGLARLLAAPAALAGWATAWCSCAARRRSSACSRWRRSTSRSRWSARRRRQWHRSPRRSQLHLDALGVERHVPLDLHRLGQRCLVAPGGVRDAGQRPVDGLALVRALGALLRALSTPAATSARGT